MTKIKIRWWQEILPTSFVKTINGLSQNPNAQAIDFVDFFSGCGGMSYGFAELGKHAGLFHHVGAFDIDRHANATYK